MARGAEKGPPAGCAALPTGPGLAGADGVLLAVAGALVAAGAVPDAGTVLLLAAGGGLVTGELPGAGEPPPPHPASTTAASRAVPPGIVPRAMVPAGAAG